jgi:transcriptional regulator with XRE-family HTH domain
LQKILKKMQDWAKILRELRERLGITQQKMADNLGIPQRTWANYENGRSAPNLDVIALLAQKGYEIPGLTPVFYGLPVPIDPQDFEKDNHEAPIEATETIPATGEAVTINFFDLEREGSGFLRLYAPAYLDKYGEKLASLSVNTDCMEPVLHRGEIAVYDLMGWSGDGIYVFRSRGDFGIRRLTRKPGMFVALCDNPKYPHQEFNEEDLGKGVFNLQGRVHCAIKRVE